MTENYDEYNRGDFDAPDDDRLIRAARARTGSPGMLLIVCGMLGVLVEIGSLALSFTQPDIMYVQLKKLIESQPPGPDRDEQIKELEDEKADYMLDTPLNVGGSMLGGILNLLMIVGGGKMRNVNGGYGLALTGAICGLIPIHGCLCCAMPVGLWAVIVLADVNVKRAFTAARRRD
jgi:hypothetical protein